MTVVSIKVFGIAELRGNLIRGRRKAEDMRSGLEWVAEDIMDTIHKNFQSQGRRTGGSWQVLDAEYVARKVKRGQDPRILISSAALMHSLTEWGDENQILEIRPHSLNLESTLSYAATQQYGDEDRNVPSRPYLRFTAGDRRRWSKILQDELTRALVGH